MKRLVRWLSVPALICALAPALAAQTFTLQDIFARMLYGGRISLAVGLAAMMMAILGLDGMILSKVQGCVAKRYPHGKSHKPRRARRLSASLHSGAKRTATSCPRSARMI